MSKPSAKGFRTVGIVISNERYAEYHRKVVAACVELMGKRYRKFFDDCSYEEDFIKGTEPEEVAEAQRDSL